MKQGTRNMWLAALLALALGAGELLAYQGIAPHAMRLGDPARAALAASRIVARNLGALAVARVQVAAGELALIGARKTTQVYRLAERVLGVADPATGQCGTPASCAGSDPEVDVMIASEPDMPCGPDQECSAAPAVERACPACPACPERAAKASRVRVPGAAAKLGRSGA